MPCMPYVSLCRQYQSTKLIIRTVPNSNGLDRFHISSPARGHNACHLFAAWLFKCAVRLSDLAGYGWHDKFYGEFYDEPMVRPGLCLRQGSTKSRSSALCPDRYRGDLDDDFYLYDERSMRQCQAT